MSDFGFDPYEDAGRDERDRQADWAESVDHWRQERDDALNRDAGERKAEPARPTHYERILDAGYEAGDPKAASVQ